MTHYVCTFRDLTQILMCRDLQDSQTLEDYKRLLPERVRLVYSDPPWSATSAAWWRKLSEAPHADFSKFRNGWISVVVESMGRGLDHIIVSGGRTASEQSFWFRDATAIGGWTLPLLETWTVRYGAPGSAPCKKNNILLHYGVTESLTSPDGMAGESAAFRVCLGLAVPGDSWTLDPCVGKGAVSRMSHYFGWNFVGSELNPKRLAVTLRWLEQQGYHVKEM